MSRITDEIALLEKQYNVIEKDASNQWVIISYDLLPGWNRNKVPILILIPTGYPNTKPNNFYVPEGFRTAAGSTPGNYTDGQAILGKKYGQFSYHLEEWRPTDDICTGHTLMSFMLGVEQRLAEVN